MLNRILPRKLHRCLTPHLFAAARCRRADATLTEQAYRAIEEAIVTLDVAPGEVVSEAQLATKLGFGRTPVREALQRLARERLVRILPRRGIVVAAVDVGEQLRLLEVRREIERLVARAAARRADAAQRARFREIAARAWNRPPRRRTRPASSASTAR